VGKKLEDAGAEKRTLTLRRIRRRTSAAKAAFKNAVFAARLKPCP